MKKIGFLVEFDETESSSDFSAQEKKLIEAAEKAAEKAYAPYSGFQVGAAVLLENGKIISGNNQENAAFPSGLCAERVALFSAMANHPNETITAVAVTAKTKGKPLNNPVTPCGACRQVLAEYQHRQKKPIKIILYQADGKAIITNSIVNLLPFTFQSDFLK